MTQQNQLSMKNGSSRMSRWFLLSFAIIALENTPTAHSFAVSPFQTPISSRTTTRLFAEEEETPKATNKSKYDPEEEVQRRLAQAKAVLAKSKAKLEAASNSSADADAPAATNNQPTSPVPFFAAKSPASKDPQRKEKLIKNRNAETGLVTADGDVMAAMSEAEEWERRSLLDVFENELDGDEDVYSEASQQLAERDVAASIWNLRKQMKTEDYLRIFDKKNFLIGEDN